MSNDFSPINTTENDAPMFAPIPSWERGKKRRSFGARSSRVAAEERSFAPAPDPVPTRPTTLSDDARAYEARMDTVDPTDTSFAAAPVYAGATARRNNGSAPIAIAAGVILLGGLAAAGWYAYQPHNTGVAQLTPGAAATTTTTTELASAAPPPAADQAAASTSSVSESAPADHAPSRTVSTTTRTRTPAGSTSHTTVTRARPAAESSADASATAPAPVAPTPAAPPAAAPPAPLVLTIPPAQAAPTPPAETPAPTQTAPTPPPTQTPPN